jgi:hypothetical protein
VTSWAFLRLLQNYRDGLFVRSFGRAMIVAYSRQVLGQTGIGHFSPIGGYHEESDHALILDVARFKYPPHWVPVQLLYEAMNTIDPDSGRTRGYMIVERKTLVESMFHIRPASYEQWQSLGTWLRAMSECFCTMKLAKKASSGGGIPVQVDCPKEEGRICNPLLHADVDVRQALLHVLEAMPLQASDLLYVRFLDNAKLPAKTGCDSEVGCEASCSKNEEMRTNHQRLAQLLEQIEELPLYQLLGELGVPLDPVEVLSTEDTIAIAGEQPAAQVTQRHLWALTVLSALQLASNSSPRARELFSRSLLIRSSPACASLAVAQWLKGEVGGDRPTAPLKDEIEALSRQILELAREYDNAAAVSPPAAADAVSIA